MSELSRCSRCGAPLENAEAPCGRCLLSQGLETSPGRKLGTGFLDDLPFPGDALVIANKYTVIGTVGRGGMGVVYKAWQENLSRVVAVKMLVGGTHASDEFKERFGQEAKAAARLQHPNIVQIYDWGEDHGQPYFSMEFVEGQTLAEMTKEGPLPPENASRYVKTIAEAIDYAHRQKILHRDLKPSNVLVDAAGQPRVTDFGLAKEVGKPSHLTATGAMMGTPGYSPPEQIAMDRKQIGPASDVYGLGAILYHLLAGRPPFVGAAPADIFRAVENEEPVSPRLLNASVSRDLETICLKCLQKQTDKRYASAAALGADLGRFLQGEPIQARPVSQIEKTWLWCRKRPIVAALLTALAFSLVMGLTGISLEWRRAERLSQSLLKARADSTRTDAQLTDHLNRLAMQNAQNLLASDRTAEALAELARIVRLNPSNTLASTRVAAALMQRPLSMLACAPLLHMEHLTHAVFSSDGAWMATATSDGRLRLWRVHDAALVHGFYEGGEIATLALSADGTKIVALRTDFRAALWLVSEGRRLELRPTLDHSAGDLTGEQIAAQPSRKLTAPPPIHWISFASDGSKILAASKLGFAVIFDSKKGLQVGPPINFGSAISAVSFSRDGQQIATALEGGSARVWNVSTGQPIGSPLLHSNRVQWVEFSRDDRLLLAVSSNVVQVWDARTLAPFGQPIRASSNVVLARLSPSANMLAVADDTRTLRLWDIHSGQLVGRAITYESSLPVFAANDRYFALEVSQRTARVFDFQSGEPITEPLYHNLYIADLAFHPRSNLVATASMDTTVRLWRLPPEQKPSIVVRHGSQLNDAALSPDERFIATAGTDGFVRVWSASNGHETTSPINATGPKNAVAWSSDSRHLLIGTADGLAFLLDPTSGLPVGEPARHPEGVILCIFAKEAQVAATATKDAVYIWDLSNNELHKRASLATHGIQSIQFSPDARRIAVASYNEQQGTVWDWNLNRNVALPHRGPVWRVAFSPDGKYVATASLDNTARIWNSETGEPISGPLRHDASVSSVTFSPDGSLLATSALGPSYPGRSATEGKVYVWEVPAGRKLLALPHPQGAKHVEFSLDGKRLLASGYDGLVRLFDVRTGLLLADPWQGGYKPVTHFAANGRKAFIFGQNDYVTLSELPPEFRQAPEWLPALAESITGFTTPDGIEQDLTEDEFRHRERIIQASLGDMPEILRQRVLQAP